MAEPPVEQASATRSYSRSPLGDAHSSAARPNYISQDNECNDDPPQRQTTRSATQNNMQEAKFWEMANAVIGEGGEPLEYKQLIANPKTQATWTHSYRNEIGRLAQGMPGCNTGTNTIVFIHKNQVPKERAKDVTYDLITTLI